MNNVASPFFFIAFLYLCSLKMSGTDEGLLRHR